MPQMLKFKKIAATSLYCALLSITNIAIAENLDGNDLHVNGYSTNQLVHLSQDFNFFSLAATQKNYTVLDSVSQYQQVVNNAREQLTSIMQKLAEYRSQDLDQQVAFITQQLSDIPYLATGAMGEGDWQYNKNGGYQHNIAHIKQDPIYRLDGLDCQTFVQVVMALLHSNDMNEFDNSILKIAYGAARNPDDDVIHYYNRNNFADADFNPINEKNGWLSDATPPSITTSANITRNNWFTFKLQDLTNNIRVLTDADGPNMVERFRTVYTKLNFANFDSEIVSLSYIPKETLAIKQTDGSYQADSTELDKIPTPAVVEIVKDVKKWYIGTKNIKDISGSEQNISHMGLLYRQTFKSGDTIYQKVACKLDDEKKKTCTVTPVTCQKDQCNELMFAQATNAYPDGYYWYQQNGQFTCSPNKPADNSVKYTQCNRVERLPLADYLTRQQYLIHPFMDTSSIIGIHVEKLL